MSEPRRNELGQPIGEPVPGWTPRPRLERHPDSGAGIGLRSGDDVEHAD